MSAVEKDKEYDVRLARQRKETDDFYRDIAESITKSNQAVDRMNGASTDWGREDLEIWPEAKSFGQEAVAHLAASREANESSGFVTGEVIKGNFKRSDSSMVSEETMIAKAVRLGEQEWQAFSGGSDDARNDITKQYAEDVGVDGLPNALAFNPPLSSAGQQPFVVIPGINGQIESISQSAQKSELSPEKKAEMAKVLAAMEPKYADRDFRNGVYSDQPLPQSSETQVKQGGGDARSQSASPAPNYGHAGGNSWGGDKIADHWSIHEDKQKVLRERIDRASEGLEEARARGDDVSRQEATLAFAQNSFAMAEHEQAARSWSNSAGYARVSHIGGMADSESALKASRMADYHRCQVEMLREKQMELKNPEIAEQRAKEAADLQAKIDEQQRYFREVAENNRQIQAEKGGPTTQEKLDSLNRFLAGQDPKAEQQKSQQFDQSKATEQAQPAAKQAEAKPAEAKPGTADQSAETQAQQASQAAQVKTEPQADQPKAVEQAQPEPQAKQPGATATQQAEVKAVDAPADSGTADTAAEDQVQQVQAEQKQPEAEAPQAEQQPEQPQAAQQAKPEPQAKQAEAPEQQQAEVKAVDTTADAGTADTAAEDQVQTKAEQKQPEAEVQQADQQVAEQAQTEPQAQQPEATTKQQAEVKAVDAPADTGTADATAEDQVQQAQTEQKQPEPEAKQAEQQAEQAQPETQAKQPETTAQVDAPADTSSGDPVVEDQGHQQAKAEQNQPEAEAQQPEHLQAAEQAQPEPQGKQAEAHEQQQADVKAVDAPADAGTADATAEQQPQQQGQEKTAEQPGQAPVAEQQANQAQHKASVENAQGTSTAKAQETGQAPQQVSATAGPGDSATKGSEAQQMSQQNGGYDPHQRVRDVEAKGQAQIAEEKEKGTYKQNDEASMNSLNEQGAQAQQASKEVSQEQEQKRGKTQSM